MAAQESLRSESARKPTFQDIKGKLVAYLRDPKSGDPYNLINQYLGDATDSHDWGDVRGEVEDLLFTMRKRMDQERNPQADIEHGTPGTITLGLPYYYPLNLTVLTYFVHGEVDSVKGAGQESKEYLMRALSPIVGYYDPYGYDVNRNLVHMQRTLFPQPVEEPRVIASAMKGDEQPRPRLLQRAKGILKRG